MTIVIFLIVLGVLILSHEFGHFIAAKRAGIRVDEFGLGFPPRLFGWKKGETTYSLNIIPFGGFVKIYGEDPEEVKIGDGDKERAIVAKSKWWQAAVLAAGVIFNLLLAWFLLALALATTGLPTSAASAPSDYQVSDPKLIVVSVSAGSPADQAGLKPGDTIVSLRSAGEPLNSLTPETVQRLTAERAGQEIIIGYLRSTPGIKSFIEEASVRPVTGLVPGRAAIGVGLETVGILKLSLPRAILVGGQSLLNLTYLTAKGLGQFLFGLFRGQSELLKQVAGPIGLATLVGAAAARGLGHLLLFTAIISINLAVLNLLPLPALDGGRLLFLLIESFKGSPIKPKIASALNLIGFALLILLMFVVSYGDIVKILH